MRWDDIYVSAAAACLGRLESTDSAVSEGRYEAQEKEASGYLAVRVADSGPAVDMAVGAGNLALERAGVDSGEVDLVVHSSVAHQGLDDFAPAAHIQSRTTRGRATPLEVRQASNGGMAALHLTAAHLSMGTAPASALLTTSDRFTQPSYDRYRTASGCLLGDGGTSLVLSRGSGVARLLSSSVLGDTTFEGLQTGDEPWCDASGGNGWPVDQNARVEGFTARHGPEVFMDLVQSIWARERETIETALADAGLGAEEIAWWVFPNMGLNLTNWEARSAFGVDLSRTTWEWGRRVGHLGAGDQFAALAHLVESGAARAGDHILLNGAGTGFSFASAVVRVLEEPEWTESAG